jgi:outer membrane protein
MKKIITLVMLAVTVLALAGCGRSSEFGVVDMQRIQNESQFYKDINADLEKKTNEVKEAMITASKSSKSQEEMQAIFKEKEGDLKLAQAKAKNKWQTGFNAAIQAVANEKKLGAVIYKEAVPQGGIDVTDDVLKNLK